MNLLDIDLIRLFKEKFGENIFRDITNEIKKENINNVNENYIKTIFEIAFYEHIGLDNKKIIEIIKDADVNDILKKHKKSILKIKKYLAKAMEDGLNIL